MAITKEDILAYLETATIMDLNDLVKSIEEKFGVSAAAPVAVAAVAAEANDEPSEVDVILKEVGQSKVGVIKVIREVTGLGLVDAKKIADGVPAAVKEKVSPKEAEEIKEKLMAAGAVVEIKQSSNQRLVNQDP